MVPMISPPAMQRSGTLLVRTRGTAAIRPCLLFIALADDGDGSVRMISCSSASSCAALPEL